MTVTTRPATRLSGGKSVGARDAAFPARDVTMARRGMAASAHPFVSQTAIEVMRHGGNAIDAAVAAAAVLTVTDPASGHIGGDTFILLHRAEECDVVALNGSGAAPIAATREHYESLGGIPEDGPLASTVPGMIRAWADALERYGTRPLGELLEPAIYYAGDGVPVTARLHAMLADMASSTRKFPDGARVFLPGGSPPPIGSTFRQLDLAQTFQRIATHGADDFYTGQLADEMARYSEKIGGLFSREDFATHASEFAEPLATSYRGHVVYEQPPVSQGIIVLLALNILREFDLQALEPGSAGVIHLLVESLKLAFADRLRWLGDPRHVDIPLEMLLSVEHACEQAARIDPRRALPLPVPPIVQPDTTYMCLADEAGNMVSYIHSLYAGSGVVMGSTGVLMNNRLSGFNLEPGHPNCLAPGKRPAHTLNSYLVHKDGKPVLVGGTPGAHWQVQTNLQILTNVLDFGMDAQRAIEAPRFTIGDQLTHDGSGVINLESRANEETASALRQLGHKVELVGPWSAGGNVQLIARDAASGLYQGATEPRHVGSTVLGF